MRKIVYVSGTRADFGLMRDTLQLIDSTPALSLSVVVTGMHLDESYGNTWNEVVAAGLRIAAKVRVTLSPTTGATMASAIGSMISAFVQVFEDESPDIVLLLGDRGEMLAGAIAAIHLNVPIAHIHGGERSGTIDESIRHAISKLSHIHFTATENARERLISLGERPDCVYVVGAPGIDGLTSVPIRDRDTLVASFGFDTSRPVALLLFHPVLQEEYSAMERTRAVLEGLTMASWQAVVLMPNSDAGGELIRSVFNAEANPDFRMIMHLPRPEYVEIMAVADAMIGNSSSGIIEAASFGTPVINLGSRQYLRERNVNVTDVAENADEISELLKALESKQRLDVRNIYGDGVAGKRIADHLQSVKLDSELLNKVLLY